MKTVRGSQCNWVKPEEGTDGRIRSETFESQNCQVREKADISGRGKSIIKTDRMGSYFSSQSEQTFQNSFLKK